MWVIQAVERPYKLADRVKIDVKRLKRLKELDLFAVVDGVCVAVSMG